MIATERPLVDLGKIMQANAVDPFWAVRGHAIQAYANIEQALCTLYAQLSALDLAIAGITFFRITSTQVRNSIIERLFIRKFGQDYNLFRNSLITQLRPIDIERNEIVHWNAANIIRFEDGDDSHTFKIVLVPPNTLDRNKNSPQKTSNDMIAFIRKCSFYQRLITMFTVITLMDAAEAMPASDTTTWLGIFGKPIIYPPPGDHPLSQIPQAPDIPPQSSPG